MKNTVNDIKEYDIKTIYFNCFDTWLEITDQQKLWALRLVVTLNISPKKLRNLLLLENKELAEILQENMPYIANSSIKLDAVNYATEKIQKEIDSIQLKPWATTVLPELQKRWYKIGVISNIAKAYVPKVHELAPITFDHMLFSCELGYKKTKQDTRIYQDAQARTEHKKREIVMIGDHETNDYDVPENYGMHTIHMDRNKHNTKANRVHTLEELLNLFPKK